MVNILPIVEGHGEVNAVPLLIRRIAARHHSVVPVNVLRPIRIGKDSLVQPNGLERAVELAARQTAQGDGILVLLDADDDCPAELGGQLLERARRTRADREIRVVLANREFEAWFLASARSLQGKRGLRGDLEPPPDPEAIRDAKGWLSKNSGVGHSYKPTIDQPALSQLIDLDEAALARSFVKFRKEVLSLIGVQGGRDG